MFSNPVSEKIQYFVHLGFNSILQLINNILSNPKKLLGCFNSTVIASFLKYHQFQFEEAERLCFPII